MDFIKLPDGYCGNYVECECEPIEKNGDVYKLRVKDSFLIRYCTRQEWEDAMYDAYIKECYRGFELDIEQDYKRMEREAKYREWLNSDD